MDERERRFEEVARHVADPLHRYLVRRTPPQDVDDVLADTMLVLWRRLDELPPDAVLPWCYRVAGNCLANSARAGRRRQRLAARVETVAPVAGTEGDAVAAGASQRVHDALEQLSDRERELVRLWAWEELTPTEIAVVLDITANAASIRLHRARRKLAGILGRDERSRDRPDMER